MFDANGSLQVNIHPPLLSPSVFLSFPHGPRLEQVLQVTSLQSISPQQALCCMMCLSWSDSPAPGGIAQIPAWVYFKASSLCTVHWLISPSLPTGRAAIMPLTTSLHPSLLFLQEFDEQCSSSMKERQLIFKGKILGFFGTKK